MKSRNINSSPRSTSHIPADFTSPRRRGAAFSAGLRASSGKTAGLRILSGKYRGRAIKAPIAAHPMGSREKLALFNAVSPFLAGISVLDVFCGSGALGLEALSRGAREAVFVDQNPKNCRLVLENAKTLDLSATPVTVVCADVAKFTTVLPSGAPQLFDLILLDPPYDDFHPEIFAHLAKNLAEGGLFVLSHPKNPQKPKNPKTPEKTKSPKKTPKTPETQAPLIPGLTLKSTKTYAAASISIYTLLKK